MDDISRYMESMNKIQNIITPSAMQAIQKQGATTQNAINASPGLQKLLHNSREMYAALNAFKQHLEQPKINTTDIRIALSTMTYVSSSFYQQQQAFSNLTSALQPILDGYTVLGIHPKSRDAKEKEDADQISEKVISEIYLPDEKKIITTESPTIAIMPANDKVFAYLAEHPSELFNLTSREFEEFMAQLYNKLGYNVELTKTTRDGGKDIILRKPDILGDMVFYVECKQYDSKNKVGIDIIQRFAGIIEMDKINGGIIATTSFFSKDAKDWIMEKDLNCRIQMHDFDRLKDMLKVVMA